MREYPQRRLRRLRRNPGLRALVQQTRVAARDLIAPVFVVEDPHAAGPIAAMPGVARHALDTLDREIDELVQSGVHAVLLFGIPADKDAAGSAAAREDGVIPQAVRRCKVRHPDLVVFTDVCLCGYTDHGHCGVLAGRQVDNDATLPRLAAMAVLHAQAGADLVAPSAMMDGQVQAIRHALDNAGFTDCGILSYAVKYASAFYGPFREAADCAPEFGDRRGYQMDPANAAEALAEAHLDAAEGADMLMVKPAGPYLDVIRTIKQALPDYPLAAYQVSGEYGMIKAAAANGWIDERQAVMEAVTGIRRAGADVVITYFARQIARWLAS